MEHKIKSFSKINVHLNVIKKLKSNFHRIETLVMFSDLYDILYDKNKFFEFYSKKIDTNNTHGTGCTISSAIAANLSKGFSLYESVSIAHKYVYKSILKAPNLGSGHGPLNHFHVIPDKL